MKLLLLVEDDDAGAVASMGYASPKEGGASAKEGAGSAAGGASALMLMPAAGMYVEAAGKAAAAPQGSCDGAAAAGIAGVQEGDTFGAGAGCPVHVRTLGAAAMGAPARVGTPWGRRDGRPNTASTSAYDAAPPAPMDITASSSFSISCTNCAIRSSVKRAGSSAAAGAGRHAVLRGPRVLPLSRYRFTATSRL